MADVYPAQQGKMGTTEYFVVTIKARALVGLVTFQTTDPEWDDLSLEERDQRELNLDRVRKQIAPYLRNDPDHFMGAIVLQAEHLADDAFDPLIRSGGISQDAIIRPYRDAAKHFGFLNLTGGEVFKPLDGQHRLKALSFAIQGLDDRGDQLPPAAVSAAINQRAARVQNDGATTRIADEDVTVIIVRASLPIARKIFTDINSYAKPTTTGQNLITNDTETRAVLARMLANNVIGARLVMYKTNNLSGKDHQFTTLTTLSKSVTEVLKANFNPKKYDKYPSDVDERQLLEHTVREVWDDLIPGLELWGAALDNKSAKGDDIRKQLRDKYLSLRPLVQLGIIQAYLYATLLSAPTLSKEEAIAKLNKIPWDTEAKLWDRVLWTGQKVLDKNAPLATMLIKYLMLGDKIGERAKADLLTKYKALFPADEQKKVRLPDPIA